MNLLLLLTTLSRKTSTRDGISTWNYPAFVRKLTPGPHPDLPEQNLHFNKIYECILCPLNFEKIEVSNCWEPPREIPPMKKVMRREPDRQRWIRPQGTPWVCLSIYPKTRICLTILCFSPTLLTLTGGYPQPPFSGKNQLRALVNGHDKSVSIQTPLMAF